MSTEARAAHFPAADWGGGALPYRVGHRKLGMWLFIVSDSLTFSALLIGYSYLRASNNWPTPFPFYPSIVFSSVMTLGLPVIPPSFPAAAIASSIPPSSSTRLSVFA